MRRRPQQKAEEEFPLLRENEERGRRARDTSEEYRRSRCGLNLGSSQELLH
jgi:hypothetical protein